MDEPAPVPPSDERLRLHQLAAGAEALLDGHDEHECGLPVGHGPVSGPDGRHRRPGARDAGTHDLVRHPPDHLVDAHALDRRHLDGVLDRDVDRVLVEADEAGVLEGRDAVERCHRTPGLPHGLPTSCQNIQRCRGHRDGLVTVQRPSLRGDLTADHLVVHRAGPQQAARQHASVVLGEVAGPPPANRGRGGIRCALRRGRHVVDDATDQRSTSRRTDDLWRAPAHATGCGRCESRCSAGLSDQNITSTQLGCRGVEVFRWPLGPEHHLEPGKGGARQLRSDQCGGG